MTSSDTRPVDVHLTTHPFATGLKEKRVALARRIAGDPHPFIDARAAWAVRAKTATRNTQAHVAIRF